MREMHFGGRTYERIPDFAADGAMFCFKSGERKEAAIEGNSVRSLSGRYMHPYVGALRGMISKTMKKWEL